ncbi:DNA-binding LacI/PurR family transcriptional regulator [Kineosphaera limosa]|uniref:Putative LacI family transcriptional regulator n=1 Tax=Kineosphaera limosa NBRC 100340 TaxID=1184609 RepID=K6X8T1_9MICO|nr:LacI family DNA-binding transcriptional regulator [Kineosphaera limosa]NYE01479.1 DNA-binding LacI/PurR family transcriptional regulator [Kineosphaera limosa]GAB95224.1 putative LacI family transcriptional regulator [Kineosphaera limosa NBRC 100340]
MPRSRVRAGTRRPTLKSVAHHAGVSVSTASLVFSGKGPVAQATRERVISAAADLGYQGPDPLASSLRRGRAGIVAVIVEGGMLNAFHDPYAVATLDGLAAELDDIPTGMLLMSQSPSEPAHAVERLGGTALDATVFLGCGPRENPLVPHLVSRGIPMVALGAPCGPELVQVTVDNRAAQREVAQHLADLGHRRVAHVTLPIGTAPPPAPTTVADLLDLAYPEVSLRSAAVADVFGGQVPAVVAATADVDGGHAAGIQLLDVPVAQRPTAVLAQSDLMAVGVIRAATDLGLAVPDQVSVTGFDGVSLDWWEGTLTTAVQPDRGKGAAAGQAIRALLAGDRPADVTLPTHLRIGTTTAAPPTPVSGPTSAPAC